MPPSWDDHGRIIYTKPKAMHGSTVVLIAILTSMATSIGTVYFVQRYEILPGKQVAEATVPDLRGLSEADARANAQVAKISLLVSTREPSSEVKPGAVVRQSIPAGQRVPPHHPVTVVIAEALPKVPSVTGLPLEEARAKLEKDGFKLEVKGNVEDAGVPQGQIIAQVPSADSGLEKGGTVSVDVAAGPGEVEVPKLSGLSVKNAEAAAEKAGLKLEVRWVALAETATYVVLNQKPPSGEKLKAGETVQVTVNR